MFGRRRREDTEELLRAAREGLDANAKQTAMVIELVTSLNATIGAEIEHTRQLETTADATTGALQHALSSQTADVSAALEHVAAMCALLAQRIETESRERHTLTEAVVQMARQLQQPEPARPRVLGGSVFGTREVEALEAEAREPEPSEIVIDDDDVVDVDTPAAVFGVGAAVSCRFGDQWIDGVDVTEIVDDSSEPAYRLRRRQDDYVLPALFRACDLRASEKPRVEEVPRIRWSRS